MHRDSTDLTKTEEEKTEKTDILRNRINLRRTHVYAVDRDLS